MKRTFSHKIFKNLCKSCELCVHYCPKNVLEIGPDRKVDAPRAVDCIGCHMCELRCPDFAIQVIECKSDEKETEAVAEASR